MDQMQTWVPEGSRRPAQMAPLDDNAIFVAVSAAWDRADQITLQHALSFSDHWLARSETGPAPDGHGLAETLRIEVGGLCDDLEQMRIGGQEGSRGTVDGITVVLGGRLDLSGNEPFEVRLPTDMALLRPRCDGLDDPQSPLLIARGAVTTNAGVIGAMMADAYGRDNDTVQERAEFRRECVESLRTYPALRQGAGEWLIKDTVSERIIPLLDDDSRRCNITIEPNGAIRIDCGAESTPPGAREQRRHG